MLLSYKRLPHLAKSFWQWVVVRRNIYSLLWKVELTTNVQDSTGSTIHLIVSAVFIFKKIKLTETWQYWAPLLLNKFLPRLAEQEDNQMKRLQQIISCPLFIEKLALPSFSLPVLPRPIFSIWSFCEQQKPNRRWDYYTCFGFHAQSAQTSFSRFSALPIICNASMIYL